MNWSRSFNTKTRRLEDSKDFFDNPLLGVLESLSLRVATPLNYSIVTVLLVCGSIFFTGCSVDPVVVEMPTDLPNTISGQILTPDGEPAEKAAVRLREKGYLADTSRLSLTKQSIAFANRTTDRTGWFMIENVDNGEYLLEVADKSGNGLLFDIEMVPDNKGVLLEPVELEAMGTV